MKRQLSLLGLCLFLPSSLNYAGNDLSSSNSALKIGMLQKLDTVIQSWQDSDDGKDYIW